MLLYIPFFASVAISCVLAAPGQGGARNNLLRLAREDKSSRLHLDFNGADVIRNLLAARSLDRLGGGEVIRILDPLTGGQMLKSLEQLSSGQGLNSLDNFRGGEVLSVLDRLTGGDFINSLDMVEGVTVMAALDKARQAKMRHRPAPKRTLDTLTGMAFGESKRFDSLSGSTFGLSKRDFDEIDNVGFTGFAKRGWGSYGRGRGNSLALAKKNFDEIDRAGFETYNKRNFDEIDRAGFETFEKRDRKD
ncbi:uncharacterized protein LOC129968717 [Argiope bruennichi]|uniref:Orcokinin peptides type A like protein n=1 Tax=Argiope bruennichi TaxID=94029 RepID=A0A8T0FSY7_ARGBR|nr:uncharacterized protein LOC129968717 [Argiope bruennichi]KAF8792799.1 Orcokinin peptides type A like protein [Argiope bruennichi]